jgi:hypothetical protein
MPDSPHANQLTFKIHPAGGGSDVPVSLLTQCLNALQEMIHLFALQEEGRTVRQRLRLSDELKSKYVLSCAPPMTGSFSVSGHVAIPTDDLFARQKVEKVMASFQDFSREAVAGDQNRLWDIVPDSHLRNRMLSRLITLSPPAGSGHRYELFNGVGPGISFDESLPGRIEGWLKPATQRAEVQTVTGRLDAISFSEHRVTIIYAPRRRGLECFYSEDIEPMLLENRRDLIQVTGRVIMDDGGHPSKIVEVEEIRELDLSPFIVSEISGNNWRVKSIQPMTLVPTLSENEQLLCLRHDAWGLDVFAPTRSELFEEFKEQMALLWEEYALEDDSLLSDVALNVKRRLREQFKEVSNATG